MKQKTKKLLSQVGLCMCLFLSACATAPKKEFVRFIQTPEGPMAVFDEQVMFKVGTTEFASQTSQIFEKLKVVFMRAKGKMRVRGHTDSTGTVQLNEKLSVGRAEKVKSLLIQQLQIPPGKIEARGYGATLPVVTPERTPEDRQKNRRAEILFPDDNMSDLNPTSAVADLNNLLVKSVEAIKNLEQLS